MFVAGCDATPFSRSLLERTQAALLGERFTLLRLDRGAWGACAVVDSATLIPRTQCSESLLYGGDALARFTDVAHEVRRALASDSSVETLRASALVDLRSRETSRTALDRAVATLEAARARAPNDASLLNDLAVAYGATAARDQQLMPMLHALDAVSDALKHEPTLASARFNRALILERLYLTSSARDAWNGYLADERDASWKAEARAHLALLGQRGDTLTAATYPQRARDAFFPMLGELGRAMVRDDRATRDSLLAFTHTTADSLEVLGADGSVSLTSTWLASQLALASPAPTLAKALIDFADGVAAYDNSRNEDSARLLATAEPSLRALKSPLARWAAFFRGAVDTQLGAFDVAGARLRSVTAEATSAEPALLGRTTWTLGVIQVRQGRHQAANRLYTEAREHFRRAKDVKNAASMSWLRTEGLSLAGQTSESAAEGYVALRALAPFRQSYALNNHLMTVAAIARAAGLRHAALELMGEVLAVNTTLNKADALAQALLVSARDHASLGDTAKAFASLNVASKAAERLSGRTRERALTEIEFVRGRLLRASDPGAARKVLAHALEEYRVMNVKNRVPAVLYELGALARARGDLVAARAHLDEAITSIEGQQGAFASAETRSAFYQTMESVFDALIGIELEAKRPEEAFALLERERAIVWRDASERGADVSLASAGRAMAESSLFVAYAVLPDRVAIWSASDRGVRGRSVMISRDSLAGLVRRFAREASSRGESPAGAALYDIILRPLASELAGVRELAIVPDRELAELPFVALHDRATRRYVVEQYSVRTLPSAAFMLTAGALGERHRAGGTALVVANPALDSAMTLASLRGADREALRVSALYPGSTVLSGGAARVDRVVAAMSKHSVFHFAGHSVFNSDRPELSYLALSAGTDGRSGRLEAREIAAMKLSNVRLVVLSACSTLRSRPSRTGAVGGVAFSFLRAGAPATVSTLWDVADDGVVELLEEFHRQLRSGVLAAEALRLAQVSALRSSRPELRAPTVWAAFVYSGP